MAEALFFLGAQRSGCGPAAARRGTIPSDPRSLPERLAQELAVLMAAGDEPRLADVLTEGAGALVSELLSETALALQTAGRGPLTGSA